jgi:uncharacterized protein (DUF58 family)
LVAGLLGRVLGVPELLGLAAATVVVVLAALVRVRIGKGAVTVSARAVPSVVEAGEPARVELTIEEAGDAGWLSSPVVLMAEDSQEPVVHQPAKIVVPRLGRGERARASFEIPTRRRGVIAAGAYKAVVTDPLGLARRRLSSSRAVRCVVLPQIEPLATVLPEGLAWVEDESTRSAAERLITGSSMLRRYAQGDDLRRVHWRTTARVGELMVRDGGDREEPDRIATTVLLDAGGEATPPASSDRAVEVAASVLAAAAGASSVGISGDYRLVTTTGLESDVLRGYEGLRDTLIALAGVGPSPAAAGRRFGETLDRLGQPDRDEVLVIVGAFGDSPPDPAALEHLAHAFSAVVLVLVGATSSVPEAPAGAGGTGARWHTGSEASVLRVSLPLGGSLAEAWSLKDLETGGFHGAPRGLIATGDRAR